MGLIRRGGRMLRSARNSRHVARTASIVVAGSFLVAPAGAQAYRIVDLGTGLIPAAVNSADLVVGMDTQNSGPAYWNAGTFGDLALGGHGTPGFSSAVDVNDSGRIVGTLYVSGGSSGPNSLHPYYWDGVAAAPHDVGTLDTTTGNGLGYGYAAAVDAAGDVVGFSDISVSGGTESRGYFAAHGANPAVVGAADAPASGRYGTEAYAVNDSGLIFGTRYITSTNASSYFLYSTPSATGTPLDLSPTGSSLSLKTLANDGTFVGAKGALGGYMRLPNGSETALTGLSQPYAVNSAHTVVGEGHANNQSTALVWKNGQTTPLNNLIPGSSGWNLQRAFDINESGDIVGIGTLGGVQHAFLLQSGITVNDTGDTHDATPGDGTCADANGKCTLRAAIEEANAQAQSSPLEITFNIPGGGVPTITPAAALPTITAPVNLDASTQPGTGRERVLLGSQTTRLAFGGLDLQGKNSSVKGLTVAGFGGTGVKLEGPGGDQLSQSAISANNVGIEVDSPNVVLDGLGVASNGNAGGASAFEAAVKGANLTPAQAQSELLGLGAGITVRDGASGLAIHGSVIGGYNPADGASPSATNQAIGVLLAPGAGPVSGVTIGDSANPNYFRGNGFGVVAAAPGAAVSSLTVAGNNFGLEPGGGGPIAPVSNGIGVLLSGNVSRAQIGQAGAKNTFIDSGVAIQALGAGVTKLVVQFNLVGSDTGLGDVISSLATGHPVLGQHNMIGLVLGDVSGATVGGPLSTQNAFIGDAIGVLMSGKQSRLNTIAGNKFGRFSVPPGKLNARPIGQYGMLEAIVASEGSANQIGVNGLGNQIKDALVGIQVAGERQDVISANAVSDNLYGLLLNDVEQTSVGNGSALASNVFEDNWIGTLQAHKELTPTELKATRLDHSPADPADRSLALTTPASTGPLNLAGALTTASVDGQAAMIEDQHATPTSFSARYGRNYIGTSSGGAGGHGNYLGMVFAGDVRRTLVGAGGGGANVIEHNHSAGIAMVGVKGHAPQGVSVLGNAIYDNSTPADPLFPGSKGLGIDLATETAGSTIFGPTPNDPGDSDAGPNGLQNYPLLTGVSRAPSGALSYELSFDSTPDHKFSVEIDSSPRCNPYGFGEGLHPLKVIEVQTSSSGGAAASVEPGLRFGAAVRGTKVPPGDRYLSATATAADGSTSEFSPCVRIAGKPVPLSALPLGTGVSASGNTSLEVFDAGPYDVQEVQLETQGVSGPAGDLATAAKKGRHTGATVIALRFLHIRSHHAGTARLRLTPAGRKLLTRKRTLKVTAIVTAAKGKRHVSTKVRYVLYAPKQRGK